MASGVPRRSKWRITLFLTHQFGEFAVRALSDEKQPERSAQSNR
jgi:hypothetical protein